MKTNRLDERKGGVKTDMRKLQGQRKEWDAVGVKIQKRNGRKQLIQKERPIDPLCLIYVKLETIDLCIMIHLKDVGEV